VERLLPILVQFGVGAGLLALGIYAGWKGGYFSQNRSEGVRILRWLVSGYLFFLVLAILFTYVLPYLPSPHE
jgi:hypothetical protein